jgi:hypothetical protein
MGSTAGAVAGARRTGGLTAAERQLLTAVVLSLLALFLGLSLLMLARRASGVFVQPLGGGGQLAAALAIGLTALALRVALSRTEYSALSTQYLVHSTRRVLLFAVPGLAAIMLLASITLPAAAPWSVAVAWFLLIANEASSWLIFHRLRRARASPARPLPPPLLAEQVEPEIPASLVQQITRVQEEGRESIHGLLRAEIPAGDRLAVVHVAFCPPLAAAPELQAHAIDAEDADVRITQAETFGTRIEARLQEPAVDRSSVLIELLGSVTRPRSA